MKTLHAASDLAINGAPPAYAEPLHVGRPNMGPKDQLLEHVDGIFERRWLTNNGPLTQELERRIAAMAGARHCVTMCNGTIALEIAIRALDLSGEVIVPSYTFIATAHALHWQGITPVFADIDPSTHNLDPLAVEKAVTPRTTGIIPVHLWGRPAAIEQFQALADRHGLKLIYDAAHAFGCRDGERAIGTFGDCEVLSFHATKVFNTFEGGAIVTNDDELAETARHMRNFGFAGYDNVVHPGTNGKMPEINAAMGLVNLEALPAFVEANRRHYARYREALAGIPGVQLLEFDAATAPNWQYCVVEIGTAAACTRDQLVEALHAENILARKYFWPGCHRMRPYRDLDPLAGSRLPHTEAVAERVVVLPTGSTLCERDIDAVSSVIRIMATRT